MKTFIATVLCLSLNTLVWGQNVLYWNQDVTLKLYYHFDKNSNLDSLMAVFYIGENDLYIQKMESSFCPCRVQLNSNKLIISLGTAMPLCSPAPNAFTTIEKLNKKDTIVYMLSVCSPVSVYLKQGIIDPKSIQYVSISFSYNTEKEVIENLKKHKTWSKRALMDKNPVVPLDILEQNSQVVRIFLPINLLDKIEDVNIPHTKIRMLNPWNSPVPSGFPDDYYDFD